MVVSLGHEDQTLLPVYTIMRNLNAKTRQSQKPPEALLLGSIPIIDERSKCKP